MKNLDYYFFLKENSELQDKLFKELDLLLGEDPRKKHKLSNPKHEQERKGFEDYMAGEKKKKEDEQERKRKEREEYEQYQEKLKKEREEEARREKEREAAHKINQAKREKARADRERKEREEQQRKAREEQKRKEEEEKRKKEEEARKAREKKEREEEERRRKERKEEERKKKEEEKRARERRNGGAFGNRFGDERKQKEWASQADSEWEKYQDHHTDQKEAEQEFWEDFGETFSRAWDEAEEDTGDGHNWINYQDIYYNSSGGSAGHKTSNSYFGSRFNIDKKNEEFNIFIEQCYRDNLGFRNREFKNIKEFEALMWKVYGKLWGRAWDRADDEGDADDWPDYFYFDEEEERKYGGSSSQNTTSYGSRFKNDARKQDEWNYYVKCHFNEYEQGGDRIEHEKKLWEKDGEAFSRCYDKAENEDNGKDWSEFDSRFKDFDAHERGEKSKGGSSSGGTGTNIKLSSKAKIKIMKYIHPDKYSQGKFKNLSSDKKKELEDIFKYINANDGKITTAQFEKVFPYLSIVRKDAQKLFTGDAQKLYDMKKSEWPETVTEAIISSWIFTVTEGKVKRSKIMKRPFAFVEERKKRLKHKNNLVDGYGKKAARKILRTLEVGQKRIE